MDVRTHKIATCAYACVVARSNDSNRKGYGALAHRLPGMILQNGLAQTTGFLLAKGGNEHLALLSDLNTVLKQVGATNTKDGHALHRAIVEGDMMRTVHLTRRALDAGTWLKRYAQGVLEVDSTGADAQSETPDDNDASVRESAGQS